MNIGEALLHACKDHGAEAMFGIPGDFALPFFKVAEESGILPVYTLSHEPAVGFAADAAARFRKRISVAAVTYGAGAFNMVNAIAGACAERSPVVVISGAPSAAERASGLLLHHQAKTIDSQFRVFEEVTCEQVRLDDPARAPIRIARALNACTEHSMPVYIELPRDMVTVPCERVLRAEPTPIDQDAVAECADEILSRLDAAVSPVLVVGVETRRYGLEEQMAALARRLGLPVVTSFMGRGLLVESDTPPVGTYLGLAGDPAVTELVEGSDFLWLFGVLLSDTNFGVSTRQVAVGRAAHASARQVQIGHHMYPEVPLGDLVDALLHRAPQREKRNIDLAPTGELPTGLAADDQPIAPNDVAAAMNDLMAKHGKMAMTSDVGDCLFTAMDMVHVPMAAPGYYAGMGFGVPAGLGAQAVTGERPVILVGDGAFQMTGWELGNCRRYGWDPIVLVFNNASWEMLRAFQPESKFNDLDDWRFAELASGLGGMGERVTTRAELRAALERAVAARGKFYLIEIIIPRGTMSRTLNRFTDAIKRHRQRQAQ